MDNDLRQLAFIPQCPFSEVNQDGKLTGSWGELVNKTEAYFTRKFNATYIAKLWTRVAGEEMDKLDRGDYDFMSHMIWEDMGPNITSGPVIFEESCMIVTRPPIRLSSDSNGLLNSLCETKLYLIIALILLWLLMITIAAYLFYRYLGWKKENLFWMFIRILFKQQNVQPSYSPARIIFPILLLSSFILLIIYGSFLNTERATMTLLDKIDSIEAIEKKGIIPLKTGPTLCADMADLRLITRKTKETHKGLSIIAPSGQNQDSISECMISGQCAYIAHKFDLNLAKTFACTMAQESVVRRPLYVSKPTQYLVYGIFMNKNVPKRKLDRLAHYAYRSYEMGLAQNGIDSMDFAIKFTLKTPPQDCLEKKIESKISAPEPLDIQFYENILLLYLLVTLMAIIIRILQFTLTIFR